MKKLFLLSALLFAPMPVMAQQVNNFAICTQNQEVYRPGGYDRYGNYVPGGVSIQTYNVPCNSANRYYRNGYHDYCNPTRSLLGALLGGGVAASMSRGNGYYWSVPVGAAIGGAMFGCN
jgi:hypothetical protein